MEHKRKRGTSNVSLNTQKHRKVQVIDLTTTSQQRPAAKRNDSGACSNGWREAPVQSFVLTAWERRNMTQNTHGYNGSANSALQSRRSVGSASDYKNSAGSDIEYKHHVGLANDFQHCADPRSQYGLPNGSLMSHRKRLDLVTDHRQSTSLTTNRGTLPHMASQALPQGGAIGFDVSLGLEPVAQPRTEPQLCDEQRRLVDVILSGRNVFYTGSAGCGKSTVLKAFVSELRARGRSVKIIAPTGKAALEVGGSTYYTYAGWVPSNFSLPLDKLKVKAHEKKVWKRLTGTDVLIIDEISMMANHAFERLNEVLKEARGSNAAFGGVQLIVTGDFCQLPPVKPFQYCMTCGRATTPRMGDTKFTCKLHGDYLAIDKWAFRSKGWQECQFEHINLTTIHRQKDRRFIDILERCRLGGMLSLEDRELLLHHPCSVEGAVKLFPLRRDVDAANSTEFSKIEVPERTFACYDDIKIQPRHYEDLKGKLYKAEDGSLAALKEHKFDSISRFKTSMAVVLQVNLDIDAGLVNGSQGVIVNWVDSTEDMLPRAPKDKKDTPSYPILGDHALYRQFHIKKFIDDSQWKQWPVVRFENGRERVIFADCSVTELAGMDFDDNPGPDEERHSLISRTQIPLIAGWAMTVHKSQGMTLNKVIVDLARAFEEGQAYVALSRARTLEGLKVVALGQMGRGNGEVKEFLKEKFGIAVN